jgi:uncharacterized protein (TIGR02246 family)
MSYKASIVTAGGLLAALAVGMLAAEGARPQPSGAPQPPAAAPQPPAAKAEAQAGDDKAREADNAAIREAGESFIKAFEGGDAKAVAARWTAEGEYISDDGTTVRGRAALEKAYAGFFAKNPKLKLEVQSDSLRFPSRDTAIAEGYFKVRKDRAEAPVSARFSALYVREDGKWLMAVLREWPDEGTSLRDIDWLIGDWEVKRDGLEVRTSYEWDENKVFIRGRFTTRQEGRTVTAIQFLGKDPSTGRLRSWTFESTGGFGEAVWTRDGRTWTADTSGVQSDGSTLHAINIVTRLNDDSFTWQSTKRTEDDAELPDLPPVKVTRVKK